MSVKHSKTSEKADGSDASQVRPSDWNANHIIDSGPCLLGNVDATASGVQNITLGANLSFSGSTLVAAGGSGSGVATSGSVSAGQMAVFTNTSTISGFSSTGLVYSTSGVITTTGAVSTSGSVTAGQVAVFTNSSVVSGLTGTGLLYIASGVTTTSGAVTTTGSVTAGQLAVFTTTSTISGYTSSGYVKLTTTGIVTTSSTISVADVPNARKLGVYNDFLHPNLFLTGGYTNTPGTGQATPDTSGNAASLRRLQYQKDTANIIYTGVTWIPPQSWNASTSLTVSIFGFKTTAGTGTKVQMKARAIAFGNNDAFSTTFTASATNINFTIGSGSSNTVFTSSGVVTIDNTPVKGDVVFIQIARDSTTGNSANDDYDNTFGVAGINISYTVDAQDDS